MSSWRVFLTEWFLLEKQEDRVDISDDLREDIEHIDFQLWESESGLLLSMFVHSWNLTDF